MHDYAYFYDFWSLIGAVITSIISGAIAIINKINKGHEASILWVVSEFLTALMCGYLVYTAYPHIQHMLPAWFTLPIAIALGSHMGGRIFQELEHHLFNKYLEKLKK